MQTEPQTAIPPIPVRFLTQARIRPGSPAWRFRAPGEDGWRAITWGEAAAQVRQAARALIALGLEPGQATCILGWNRPEWVALHLATMAAGGAPAGIYTTSSAEQIDYVLEHSQSRLLLVDDPERLRLIKTRWARLSRLRHVVVVGQEGVASEDSDRVLSWSRFLAAGETVPEVALDARLRQLRDEHVGTVIYTSGTTGPPKAVMLSHANLSWTADVSARLVNLGPEDHLFSYLPLSHIAEQAFTIYGPACSGTPVSFASAPETVLDDLRQVGPTVFFGVPRVWEKVHAGVAGRIAGVRGVRMRLLRWAMSVARRAVDRQNQGLPLGTALSVSRAIAAALVLRPVRRALGLHRARLCITGAAPTPRAVLEFLAGLDLPLHEVYGQSEASGPTTFNRPGRTRFSTVGTPIPGVEVRVAEDGEILVRGPNVFLGYARDPQTTREVLVDGWLRTGDLGALDADGFLTITGRKKDIIITAGGKNITPSLIEEKLRSIDLVSDAVVVGDRRRFLVALLALDAPACEAFLARNGEPRPPSGGQSGGYDESPAIQRHLEEAVNAVNTTLGRVEQIKRFHVLPRALSIVAGELTPTLKVRRKTVEEHFAPQIESLYAERSRDEPEQRAPQSG